MGGHGPVQKTKYFSIHDVPDELVSQYSKRDPDNKIYQTRRWVNFKKKQILFQQRDGVPGYMRTTMGKITYRLLWVGTVGCLAYNIYTLNRLMSKK